MKFITEARIRRVEDRVYSNLKLAGSFRDDGRDDYADSLIYSARREYAELRRSLPSSERARVSQIGDDLKKARKESRRKAA